MSVKMSAAKFPLRNVSAKIPNVKIPCKRFPTKFPAKIPYEKFPAKIPCEKFLPKIPCEKFATNISVKISHREISHQEWIVCTRLYVSRSVHVEKLCTRECVCR